MRVQTALSMIEGVERIDNRLAKINVPMFAVHGVDDGVTSANGLAFTVCFEHAPLYLPSARSERDRTERQEARHLNENGTGGGVVGGVHR